MEKKCENCGHALSLHVSCSVSGNRCVGCKSCRDILFAGILIDGNTINLTCHGNLTTKYLVFKLRERKEKTVVYDVFSKHHGCLLGGIYWYSSWRQYIFEPVSATIFNVQCLETIKLFMEYLMQEWRDALRKSKLNKT